MRLRIRQPSNRTANRYLNLIKGKENYENQHERQDQGQL
jgi:hypothetical protein